MDDSESFNTLVGHLVNTARAHHTATGGVNPQWSDWYAEHLVDDVNRILGTEKSVEELATWLAEADLRYRSEEQDMSWPKAYATWLLAGAA